VTYSVQVLNSGCGRATNVVLDDHMSPYTAIGLNTYGTGVPFQLVDGSPASGLSLGTPDYSNDGGSTFGYPPASATGYDGDVTNWKIPMTGSMATGGRFTLQYKVKVK
jgi:hypothetical protein